MDNNYPFVMLPVQIFQEDLSASDFKVFGILASHTNKDRVCRVFVRTISEKTGINRATVFRSLSKLEALGYIKRQNNKTNTFGANFYYIDFNPQPSCKNATSLVAELQLPSCENAIHKELDLKELYLNSKNLKRASAQKNQKEVLGVPEVNDNDKQIVQFIKENYQEVSLWAQVIKTSAGLAIRPISRLAEKNINQVLPEVIEEISDIFSEQLVILPASSNVLNSVEVA